MIPPLQLNLGHAIKTAGKTRTRRERVMEFIHDDFLLHSEMARRLYHDYAAEEPVLDYHSHLPSADIASDHRFRNLWEIWLQGDHYKWRLMRANGVPEKYCTGDVPEYEKFLAWARTVPATLRSPLYVWTHLELKRYFGIGDLLNENNAKDVWEQAELSTAKRRPDHAGNSPKIQSPSRVHKRRSV